MLQIIPENRKPTTAERFNAMIQTGLGHLAQYQQQQQLASQGQKISQLTGMDLSGLPPELQQEAFKQHILGQREKELQGVKSLYDQNKNKQDLALENESYNKIKDSFGEKFADIWKASPVGARTELTKMAIDAKMRGLDVDALLKNNPLVNNKKSNETNEIIPQLKIGDKLPKNAQLPDFTKAPEGYTPKEWREERKEWRKENAPLYQEIVSKGNSLKKDIIATNRIEKIHKKLPEGFERFLINPETGEFYGAAEVAGLKSPEAQEFSKLIATFQNRAKEAFGSRVTNFDLQSYMKQFPGLLNTVEGRERILKMMKINLNLDQLYNHALKQIYDHYGLNSIPQEEADRLAQEMIKDETEKLSNDFINLDQEINSGSFQEQSKTLTNDVIDKYIEKANGDAEKAAELAKKDGYVW